MTTTIVPPNSIEDRFSALFELLDGTTLNGNSARLNEIRQQAISSFKSQGLPTRKSERWKYTPIEKHLSVEHSVYHEQRALPLTASDIANIAIPELDGHLVVTLNGHWIPELSSVSDLQASISFVDLKAAAEQHETQLFTHFGQHADIQTDPFVALNTAFLRDGLYFSIPAGVQMDKPIYMLHLFDADGKSIVQPRVVVVGGAESRAVFVEHFHSLNQESHFINTVSEWVVERQAHLHHYQIQDLSTSSHAIFNQHAYQAQHSMFSTHTSTLQGGLIRNNLHITPDAEECESHLLGLVMGSGSMHVDNHTLVDHKKPHCFSNELYKNILDDNATGVFNGKVLVRPDAQKINAYQSNKSITLTDTARMYSKPELEIYADDVKCSHGATTGQLDTEALFYLQSRGLNKQQARAILLLAFARDVVDVVEIDALRNYIDARIAAML